MIRLTHINQITNAQSQADGRGPFHRLQIATNSAHCVKVLHLSLQFRWFGHLLKENKHLIHELQIQRLRRVSGLFEKSLKPKKFDFLAVTQHPNDRLLTTGYENEVEHD